MPIHNWTRVKAGIFHHFHLGWINNIALALNKGGLPEGYYALAEQYAAGFGPDILTLQGDAEERPNSDQGPMSANGKTCLLLAPPRIRLTAETDMEFYRRKQNTVTVRQISGDRVVAVVEVMSRSNKETRHSLRSFIEETAEFLDNHVHLLILDLFPPGKHDPSGIHGAIWEDITDQEYALPADKPLTLAAYESALAVRAYVEQTTVGAELPEMPLYLEPGGHVDVPLEATYQAGAGGRFWRRQFSPSANAETQTPRGLEAASASCAAHRAPDDLVEQQIVDQVFLGEIERLANLRTPGASEVEPSSRFRE